MNKKLLVTYKKELILELSELEATHKTQKNLSHFDSSENYCEVCERYAFVKNELNELYLLVTQYNLFANSKEEMN